MAKLVLFWILGALSIALIVGLVYFAVRTAAKARKQKWFD